MTSRWKVACAPFTHLLMNGGMLFVPMDEVDEFYEAYISEITQGTKLYIVEKKTEVFKFFVDIDYKAKEKLDKDTIERICRALHSIVKVGRCCIALTKSRECKEGIKTGVHVHWPDLSVTKKRAMELRAEILSSFPPEFKWFDWEKVIDLSVYGGSGLRMIWSHKMPTGDPYIPWKILDGKEFSKEFKYETLKLFCVRTDEEDTKSILDETTSSELQRFVNKYITGQEEAQIKRISKGDDGIFFVQTDSKYCENIGKEHKSNHVYFFIKDFKISQRCHDEECGKSFEGRVHDLNYAHTVVKQLKDASAIHSTPRSALLDILPADYDDSLSFVH